MFVVQINCAVTPTIPPASASVQKKSDVVYEFEPSDDSLQPEELDSSTDSPNYPETNEIKNETVSGFGFLEK